MIGPRTSNKKLADYGLRRERGFLIRRGHPCAAVLLRDDRIERTAAFMRRRGLRGVEMNRSLGYRSDDVSCLRQFPFLTGLSLILGIVPDLSPIHSLGKLRWLSLQAHWLSRIDLGHFPKLTHCRLMWRPGAKSVFECSELRWLFFDYFKSKDLRPVLRLKGLESLTISNSPLADIDPISELQPLKELGLINLCKLERLDALRPQTELEKLEIDGTRKLTNIDALSGMTRMRTLYLCNAGRIASLKPLRNMRRLRYLYMWEDTVVEDGDLRPLLELTELKRLALANRRHYSHSPDEILRLIRDKRRRAR